MKIGLISLGCSKNQVDSEMILSYFKDRGYEITNNPKEANIIVVNTCGFIASAKKEAIDTLLEFADYKNKYVCKYLIATGCFAKRYKQDIIEQMPEIDLVIGVDEYNNFDEIFSNFLNQQTLDLKLDFSNRIVSTNFPTIYIRISDGCNNRCSYCAIPLIRGNLKSRPIEDILTEVEIYAKKGFKEFCIISQDTSNYGKDLYGDSKIVDLIRKMSKISGIKWIRILYMYLSDITDELVEEIKINDKVCKYFDIPIQHASTKVLKSMNRRDTTEGIYDKILKIRNIIPNAILRTTYITGFPGESEEDFEILKKSVIDLKFERMGAFAFSKEEDTPAFKMQNQILQSVKKKRLKTIMEIQSKINKDFNSKQVGKTFEVLVESISEDEQYFVCRSYMEAPDVDGRIYIKIDKNTAEKIIVGDFYNVIITDYSNYDLFAKLI